MKSPELNSVAWALAVSMLQHTSKVSDIHSATKITNNFSAMIIFGKSDN